MPYRYVVANDLSPSAVQAIERNVTLNGLNDASPEAGETCAAADVKTEDAEPSFSDGPTVKGSAPVRVNEGDAW